MAKFSPHHSPYKTIAALQLTSNTMFWIVFVLSVASGVTPNWSDYALIKQAADLINIICILAFFILEIIAEYVFVPIAEQKRRDDFIDNSFGSKFMIANSVDYYDNEEVQQGLYKAGVNLFENVFFTFSLVRTLTFRKIVVPAVVLTSVWVIAYYGFSKVPFALTVLQVFFSAQILGELIKHLILRSQLHHIQNDLLSLFKHSDLKLKMPQYAPDLFRSWVSYETLISRISPGVSDNVFSQHNAKLTAEWKDVKTKYAIG